MFWYRSKSSIKTTSGKNLTFKYSQPNASNLSSVCMGKSRLTDQILPVWVLNIWCTENVVDVSWFFQLRLMSIWWKAIWPAVIYSLVCSSNTILFSANSSYTLPMVFGEPIKKQTFRSAWFKVREDSLQSRPKKIICLQWLVWIIPQPLMTQ